jgi:hypothetical protein
LPKRQVVFGGRGLMSLGIEDLIVQPGHAILYITGDGTLLDLVVSSLCALGGLDTVICHLWVKQNKAAAT